MKFHKKLSLLLIALALNTAFDTTAMKRDRSEEEQSADQNDASKASKTNVAAIAESFDLDQEFNLEPLVPSIELPEEEEFMSPHLLLLPPITIRPPEIPMPTPNANPTALPTPQVNADPVASILSQLENAVNHLQAQNKRISTQSLNRLYSVAKQAQDFYTKRTQEVANQKAAKKRAQEAARIQKQRDDAHQAFLAQANNQLVNFESADGDKFSLARHQAELSETLKNVIEGAADVANGAAIPLPNISTTTFRTIASLLPQLQYLLAASRQDPTIFIPSQLQPEIKAQLAHLTRQDIIDLLKAANYLDLPFLINGFASELVDTIGEADLKKVFELATLKNKRKKSKKEKEDEASLEHELQLLDATGWLFKLDANLRTYVDKYLAHRKTGIPGEFSVADCIRRSGQPKLVGEVQIKFDHKLTSLFGLELIENPEAITEFNLHDHCFYSFAPALNPQPAVRPFARFTNLKSIFLIRCGITQLSPQMFEGFSGTRLRIEYNNFRQIPNHCFAGATKLKSLRLEHNQTESIATEAFSGLNELTDLNLGGNKLTRLGQETLKGLKALTHLNLQENQISQIDANALTDQENLQQIGLFKNKITSLPEGLFDSIRTGVLTLNIGINKITKISDAMLDVLAQKGALDSKIYLGNNKFSTQEKLRMLDKLKLVTVLGFASRRTLEKKLEEGKNKKQKQNIEEDEEEYEEDEDDDVE